jgi:glucose/arabinose dehydrogenase
MFRTNVRSARPARNEHSSRTGLVCVRGGHYFGLRAASGTSLTATSTRDAKARAMMKMHSMMVRAASAVLVLVLTGCPNGDRRPGADAREQPPPDDSLVLSPSQAFPTILIPEGYQVEKVVDGLTYPTALTFDDQGRMYVAEAGGAFLDLPPPGRILRIEGGSATEVVNLDTKGVQASVVGLTWHDGAFFISHRDPADRSGAVSRVTPGGEVTRVLTGILDAQAEHQVNDLKVGPDGRMYLGTGPATNAGVVGLDLVPFIMQSPGVRPHPCQEIVLTGINYRTPDFRTPDPSDTVETGAYSPFGTPSTPGQRVPGSKKCGGSVLVFDPTNAEATVQPFASGLRNVVGLAFNSSGELFAAVNGYDIRGSRSVNDEWDATYRIRQGAWYGWPDFSAAFEPVTDPKFDVPDAQQPAKLLNGQPLPMDQIHFVVDHAASGLTAPDASLIAGLHPVNSSPSGLDVAPASFGSAFADKLLIAEWGDLAPPTNPLRNDPVGSRIVMVDPATRRVVEFARNAKPGPASAQMAAGMGLERPYYVKFGPDGALYVVDYGVARINPASMGTPYEFPEKTGAIWKISRTGQ